MEPTRWLFHLVSVKSDAPAPDAGKRSLSVDEESDARWLDRMEGHLRFEGKTVLDLGCGTGTLGARAAAEGASRVVGVDLHVEEARRRLPELPAEVRDRLEYLPTNGDLSELGDEQFDIVTSKDSMEHFPDPESFIELMTSRVKPGGELAIGFSPLWKSPKGGHIGYMTKLPWAHLIFPESTIMAERRRFFPDQNPATFSEVAGGLNKMTLERFERIIAGTGFPPAYLRTNPGDRRAMRAMRTLSRIRPLREYLTISVYGIWRKPADAT